MMRAIFTRQRRFLRAFSARCHAPRLRGHEGRLRKFCMPTQAWSMAPWILCLILMSYGATPGFAQAVNSTPSIPSAVSGTVLTQPSTGWNITVDSRWLDGQGYRPVRITVIPNTAVSADQDLLVRVKIVHCYMRDPLIVAEKYISIPSGTNAGRPINASISLPPSPLECDFSLEIIDPSSTTGTVFQQMLVKGMNGRMGITDLDTVLSKYPHILFVGNTLPNTAMMTNAMPPLQVFPVLQGNVTAANLPPGASIMGDGSIVLQDGTVIPNNQQPAQPAEVGTPAAMPGYGPGGIPPGSVAGPAPGASQGDGTAEDAANPKLLDIPLPSAMSLPAADLPENWIDYTSLDIVVLSLDQLADLAKNHPAAYRAILQWTAAGGNLWICGISGSDGPWQRLDEVNKLLKREGDAPAEPSKSGKSDNSASSAGASPSPQEPRPPKLEASGWREPGDEGMEFLRPSDENAAAGSPRGMPPGYPGYQPPVEEPAPKPAPISKQPMLLREYGMGTVAILSANDPFTGKEKWMPEDWGKLFRATGAARWLWNTRHGVNIGQQNPSFWNFLIPGVGLAPVRSFQVFITLFVLGIGPLNYWLLRRRQRLHLMVLTVPLSAAVVTAMIFGYALVADGLGIRVRARSITRLDARRGEATTWTRLSYYAGISPSKGLEFSPNTAVYPILDKTELDPFVQVHKKMAWDNNQLLQEGWLNARTPTQYLTVRSGPSSCRLIVTKPADAKGDLTVENRLGTPIEQMALCGLDGKFYYVENVGEGAKAQAKLVSDRDLKRWLKDVVHEQSLEFPLGLNPGERNRSMFVNNRNYYWSYNNFRNTNSADTGSSLLEGSLGRMAAGSSRLMAFGCDVPLLEPGAFVAKVPHAPEVELGTDSAREEASLHVIVGEW